jgi:hypothetical protein
MVAAELAARKLARLNASAKGYGSAFVLIRNRLAHALPLYDDGPTTSQRRMIDDALDKIGPAADQVHETYQQLINLDADQGHHDNYYERQHVTGKEHNNLITHADEVLSNVEGLQQ